MNWLAKISKKDLIDEVCGTGLTEKQLRADGVQIFKSNGNFFVSFGDWTETEPDDLIGAIKKAYPDSEVEWDFEAGPPDNWEIVF